MVCYDIVSQFNELREDDVIAAQQYMLYSHELTNRMG